MFKILMMCPYPGISAYWLAISQLFAFLPITVGYVLMRGKHSLIVMLGRFLLEVGMIGGLGVTLRTLIEGFAFVGRPDYRVWIYNAAWTLVIVLWGLKAMVAMLRMDRRNKREGIAK